MPVIFTASSMPPPDLHVASRTIGGDEVQAMQIIDDGGTPIGMVASPLTANIANSPSVIVTNAISASIINAPCVLQSGAWAVSASLANSPSVIQSGIWSVSATVTNSPSVIVNSGSVIITNQVSASISNSPSVIQSGMWSIGVTNQAGSAAGSPLFTSTTITNLAGSASGSPLFTSTIITNQAGSAAGSPWFSSITNLAGSASGSPLWFRLTDGTDNAIVDSASRLLTSACVVNSPSVVVLSAAASPLFFSQNNMTGSSAGSPTFISITNQAGSAAGSPFFDRITDGTWSYSTQGSPLSIAEENGRIWVAGSVLSTCYANISSSAATCTVVVAGVVSKTIRVIALTVSTSGSQLIGWNSGSVASAIIQSPMPFGNNTMLEIDRAPHAYVFQAGSGSALIMTTTSACWTRGNLIYLSLPG